MFLASGRISAVSPNRLLSSRSSVSRLFRFSAVPGAPLCASGGLRGSLGDPPDPRKSCFRLGKTTISAFEAFSALCGPERKKTRCARMRFSPFGPFLGPRESRGSPRGVPEDPLFSPRVEKRGVRKSTRKKGRFSNPIPHRTGPGCGIDGASGRGGRVKTLRFLQSPIQNFFLQEFFKNLFIIQELRWVQHARRGAADSGGITTPKYHY